MSIVRATILTVLLVLPAMLPSTAYARPNDGRYKNGAQGAKALSQAETCDLYKGLLQAAEKEANKRAGTAAAAPYSLEADLWWDAAVHAGCSWTK